MLRLRKNNYFRILLHLFLCVVFVLVFPWLLFYLNDFFDIKHMILTAVILVSIFYLNYYLLIPRFLSNRKFKEYAGTVIVVLTIVYCLSTLNQPKPPEFKKESRPPLTQENSMAFDGVKPARKHRFFDFGILILSTISIAVSTSIYGTKEWFVNENQLKEIENQKLSAELSFLKAQINPHFFFNTLNGIYALARKKSDQTPEIILKLSELMRYIIYEADTVKVLLSREVAHIENYIELQRIRLNDMFNVSFNVKGNAGLKQIEPLLFSVFLENAFKHGIDYTQPGEILINLEIRDDELIFFIQNPIAKRVPKSTNGNNGVGLKNIKKRLNLVYPRRHELTITTNENKYTVELKLSLSEA